MLINIAVTIMAYANIFFEKTKRCRPRNVNRLANSPKNVNIMMSIISKACTSLPLPWIGWRDRRMPRKPIAAKRSIETKLCNSHLSIIIISFNALCWIGYNSLLIRYICSQEFTQSRYQSTCYIIKETDLNRYQNLVIWVKDIAI